MNDEDLEKVVRQVHKDINDIIDSGQQLLDNLYIFEMTQDLIKYGDTPEGIEYVRNKYYGKND